MKYLLVLLMMLCAAPARQAGPNLDRQVSDLHTAVSFVTTGSQWKADGASGPYRVVVLTSGWEHVSSRVYLQWLEEDQGRRELRVRQSVLVQELSSGFWSVGPPSFNPPGPGVRITLEAFGTYSFEKARFTLTPTSVGKYTIQKAKK